MEAIGEELTTAELAKKYNIHPTLIGGWKRTAIENMAQAFGGTSPGVLQISERDVEKLHVRNSQLVVERDAPPRLRGSTGATVAASMSETSSLVLSTGGKLIWRPIRGRSSQAPMSPTF
ncbi:hypothetical protein [Leisingera sp.]|uniref:hypothetical protein n=1 Tax=Leisingera sp. TaxID=1879318 RepID=UPI002B279B3E|nr:hypothetical protein [Leisingera sp.]